MKRWLWGLAAFLLGACSFNQFVEMLPQSGSANTGGQPEQGRVVAELPNYGPAPELTNTVWLNSKPLRLAELRGKVVLIDMWTFG
jgi:hypothetical protein